MRDPCAGRRPGRREGRHRAPPWWPEGERWPPVSSRQAMALRRVGRRVVWWAGAVIVAAIVLPLAIGALLAATIGGWVSVVIAAVSWLGLALVVGVALRSGLRLWGPAKALMVTTGRLADGDYSARVGPVSSRVLEPVAKSFDRMAERMESAELDRRQLLADVGHELRTPLTIVRGELEAMADGVHELDVDRIQRLLGDVSVMERLLEDLHTLSTAEAGMLEVHREAVDVAEVTAVGVERFEGDAARAGVTLTIVAPPDGVVADVDPVRVQEIVSNLVGNALRATPAGGRIGVKVAPVDPESADRRQGAVLIEVADTGHGIPAAELEQVFDRFHSGAGSDGSGLGLTITRNLVEAHGGDIGIASTQGEGTTVSVRLPASHGA